MDIPQATKDAALYLLKVHKEYCTKKATRSKEQDAYYKGLLDMAEVIFTDNHTHDSSTWLSKLEADCETDLR